MRIRFSLKLLLGVLISICLLLGWLSSRIPHCRAVEKLSQIGVKITWMRKTPSWLGKKLGLWRLDRVKSVYYVGGSDTDFSMIRDLNYLEEFSTFECLEIDYQPLLHHANTIRYLGLDPYPIEPETFYSHFENLEDLLINRDTDLSQLSHLKKLKSIRYYNWANSDFKHIAAFKNLEHAGLHRTRIKSTKPLSQLKKLRTLILDGCQQLEDISSVGQLPHLRELSLDGCYKLTDLSPIAECKNLEILALPPTGKFSLPTDLVKLKELHSLLNFLDPNDLAVLGHFPELEHLNLDWSRVKQFDGVELDLKLLREKNNLKYLCACRITDSDDLARFPNLRKLIIRDSVIKNADSIRNLSKLKMLILSRCEFSNEVLNELQSRSYPDGFRYYRKQ